MNKPTNMKTITTGILIAMEIIIITNIWFHDLKSVILLIVSFILGSLYAQAHHESKYE